MIKRTVENSQVDDPLIPVPIPALVTLLIASEREKGAPLTEEEVLEIRDNCGCMMLPLSQKRKAEAERGYSDIDPDNVWTDWQVARELFFQDRS